MQTAPVYNKHKQWDDSCGHVGLLYETTKEKSKKTQKKATQYGIVFSFQRKYPYKGEKS